MKLVLKNRKVNDVTPPDITINGIEVITIDVKRGMLHVDYRDKDTGPHHGEFELASWPNNLPNLELSIN